MNSFTREARPWATGFMSRARFVLTVPGWRKFAVTPVPRSRLASSTVSTLRASLDRPYAANMLYFLSPWRLSNSMVPPGRRAHVDHPRGGARLQPPEQQISEQERRDDIHREGQLEPVCRSVALPGAHAGVVDQNVEPVEPLLEILRELAYRGL